MTSAIAVYGSDFSGNSDYEPVTDDGCIIRRTWMQERNYLRGSASDWLPVVDAALGEIRKNCATTNWDGSGAIPVPLETVNLVADIARALYTMLPNDGIPPPDIVAETDGEICVSWSGDSDRRLFSLSIGTHGKINFAGQFGNEGSIHGWQPIDTTTIDSLKASFDDVSRNIRRLFVHTSIKRKVR